MDFYGTIGPACAQPAILQHMVEAGMTGIRMNLSHGPLAAHTDWLAMIRAAGIRQLLIDLQGPELRIGTLAEPVALVEGSSVRLGADRQLWYRRLRPDSSFCWTTASFWCRSHRHCRKPLCAPWCAAAPCRAAKALLHRALRCPRLP